MNVLCSQFSLVSSVVTCVQHHSTSVARVTSTVQTADQQTKERVNCANKQCLVKMIQLWTDFSLSSLSHVNTGKRREERKLFLH